MGDGHAAESAMARYTAHRERVFLASIPRRSHAGSAPPTYMVGVYHDVEQSYEGHAQHWVWRTTYRSRSSGGLGEDLGRIPWWFQASFMLEGGAKNAGYDQEGDCITNIHDVGLVQDIVLGVSIFPEVAEEKEAEFISSTLRKDYGPSLQYGRYVPAPYASKILKQRVQLIAKDPTRVASGLRIEVLPEEARKRVVVKYEGDFENARERLSCAMVVASLAT
ncbi:hypothetical protein FNV43_RR02122 [Rhamnella rubrinervis]|uniref:Uncharacterized protein n=1 Tax=Rhamnella rubrinervis TaxID=2594499 RepID=A0A8K0HS74_9ROSA|nr:hypothetical protein FNV43_RR02122 [Rhamnella rubrinervis]